MLNNLSTLPRCVGDGRAEAALVLHDAVSPPTHWPPLPCPSWGVTTALAFGLAITGGQAGEGRRVGRRRHGAARLVACRVWSRVPHRPPPLHCPCTAPQRDFVRRRGAAAAGPDAAGAGGVEEKQLIEGMDLVMRTYEREMQAPLRNFVGGELVRTLLIQVRGRVPGGALGNVLWGALRAGCARSRGAVLALCTRPPPTARCACCACCARPAGAEAQGGHRQRHA